MLKNTKKINLYNALGVIVKDPKISKWLKENDPKAYEQASNAFEPKEKRSEEDIIIAEAEKDGFTQKEYEAKLLKIVMTPLGWSGAGQNGFDSPC